MAARRDYFNRFRRLDTIYKGAIGLGVAAVLVAIIGHVDQHAGLDLRELFHDFYSNIGTELLSIVLTVFIVERAIRRHEEKERTEPGLKARLIAQLDSRGSDEIKRAVAELRQASLRGADLRGAQLSKARLQSAILYEANLQDDVLTDAQFDEKTVLPNGERWTPETELARYTNAAHLDFWRSDDPQSPACRLVGRV